MSELTDDRLEPCPFCGWAITADEGLCKWDKDEFGDTVDEITYTGVCCPGCSAFVPINTKTAAEAIAAWNRRAAASTSTEGAGVKEREAAIEEMAEALRKCLMTRTGDAIKLTNVFVYERAGKALQAYRALTPPASKVTTDEAEERG